MTVVSKLAFFFLLLLYSRYCYALLPAGAPSTPNNACSNTNTNLPNAAGHRSWRLFNQLSRTETDQVIDFLVTELGYYDLRTRFDFSASPVEVTPNGPNLIYTVQLMEPVKEDVLEFLDNQGPEPKRYALVIVIRSENNPKDVMEYKVGPLPLTPGAGKNVTQTGVNGDESPREGVIMQKLRADGEVPFIKRPSEPASTIWADAIIEREAFKLRSIFKDTTGWCYGVDRTDAETTAQSLNECGRDLIEWLSFPALDEDTSKRIMHVVWFFRTRRGGGEEMNLHSIPISFKLDETDPDNEKWIAFEFEYCHQGPFATAEDLLSAFHSGSIAKCVAEDWKDYNYDESWARTNNRNRFRAGSDLPAPRTFYPAGPRFTTDEAEPGVGFYFNYLGWEGHVSVRYITGIAFHDIKFRGNRIVYEMALQDQFVAYGGYAGGGQTVYMDSYYGIGLSSQPLKKGIDCPETAQYFRISKFHISGYFDLTEDAICIFEEDGQTPEWRHTHFNGSEELPHSDSVRRSALVVRTVATVGNYDYLYSIRFKPDASIEVETTLAGYMLTTFFDTNGQTERDRVFGTRVHKHSLATLHDHLSGWKVDLDVLGTANSIRKLSVRVGTWEEALASVSEGEPVPPAWHRSPYVKYIHSERAESEFGYLIRDPGTMVHTFTNEQFTNTWGQPRGYAIMHGLTTRQLLPDTHPFTKAASWTKYHLSVTKRKENEWMSHGAIYDMVAPGDPIVSLDHYIDGESIVQDDLTAWVMTGLMHIPRSEDVPLISNFGSRFYIKPWNYHDELVSMDMSNNEAFSSCRPIVGNEFDYTWRP